METTPDARSTAPPHAWPPIPGPVDRESFFDAQRRNRRATWRLSAVSAVIVVALGLIVSCVLVPAVLFQLFVLFGLLGVVLPPAKPIANAIEWYLTLFIASSDAPRSQLQTVLGLIAWVAPGVLALVATWLGLRRIFREAGIGGALLTLGAREPRTGDLEERQLVNVVEEMAIAGGVEPPRVLLLDEDLPNAAALGIGAGAATVVISRRLLDDMDRDETQAVLGHLIGSIGNGDLGVIWTILSVFQTFGLLMVLVDLPTSPAARRTFVQLLRFVFGRRDAPDRTVQADAISRGLARQVSTRGMEDLVTFMGAGERKDIGTVRKIFYWARTIVLFPLLIGVLVAKILLNMTMLFLLGWLLAITWRTRRYLADATAVRLTRNPDGLARALLTLRRFGAVLPGARQLDFLFIVGSEAAQARADDRLQQAMGELREPRQGEPGLSGMIAGFGALANVMADTAREAETPEWRALSTEEQQARMFAELRARGQEPSARNRSAADVAAALEVLAEHQRASDEAETGTFADEQGILASFHPPLDRRLKRLQKLGATVTTA